MHKTKNKTLYCLLMFFKQNIYTAAQLAEAVEYDAQQSDGEVPGMLELWGMQSTPS